MSNFYVDVLQRDSRFTSPAACADEALLEPGFRARALSFMAAAAAAGTTLKITETYRSSERQQQLFAAGKTKLQNVGVHHYGLACDFAKVIGGSLSWDGDWTFMAKIAAEISTADAPLISGVDWGSPDEPHDLIDSDHIQGVTIGQQPALFAGSWYPGADDGHGGIAPIPASVSVATAATPVPADLTPVQAEILAAVDKVNAESFGGWFRRSTVFAFIEVESNFDPKAYRKEPSGVASYGLMQVLDSTAASLGLTGDPAQMYAPIVSIFYGMKYAALGWNLFMTKLGRPPTLQEWSEGYNEGFGAALAGKPDPNYFSKWGPSRDSWRRLDPV